MSEVLKINNEAVFDNNQEELSDKEKKLIQENKDLFQLQFETHKSTIVRNLDKANKKLLVNMYQTDADVKKQVDRLENDIKQDATTNKYYQNFLKRINKIKNPQKKEQRKLMGLMQLASMKCIAVMNAEVSSKWKKWDTIEKVLSASFYKVKNSGVDGFMGPNTASVFMDILGRDPSLPKFDGTISKALIKKIYDECQPVAQPQIAPTPAPVPQPQEQTPPAAPDIQKPNTEEPKPNVPQSQIPAPVIETPIPPKTENQETPGTESISAEQITTLNTDCEELVQGVNYLIPNKKLTLAKSTINEKTKYSNTIYYEKDGQKMKIMDIGVDMAQTGDKGFVNYYRDRKGNPINTKVSIDNIGDDIKLQLMPQIVEIINHIENRPAA